MELLYLRYIPDNRCFLLLDLGQRNNKICGLLSEKVPDSELKKILGAKQVLIGWTLDRRLQWLKEHCPRSYSGAYREVLNRNAQVISRHAVGAAK